MADVRPLRGLRFNAQRYPDLSLLITPPYDIISPEEQDLYYHRSSYSIIRLELGQDLPGDTPQSNRYIRAAAILQGWLQDGVLVRDEKPTFYLVEHQFMYQERQQSRWGLMARVRLEEPSQGSIRPHEVIMREPYEDRTRLLETCRTNISPIMGLFQDPEGAVFDLLRSQVQGAPAQTGEDTYGVSYRLWAIQDRDTLAQVSRLLAPKPIYIADGHHRYETALGYSRRHPNPDGAAQFVLMTLTATQDPGLIILPTHRLVRGLEQGRIEQLKAALPQHFNMKRLRPTGSLSETLQSWLAALGEAGRGRAAFGLYGPYEDSMALLVPKQVEALRRTMPQEHPRPWKDLDVSLLHWAILRGMLGLDGPEKEKASLDYTRDGLEALSRVRAGECQMAFFLNPTPIAGLLAIADASARMPQKSTYFHPKTATGLVLNPLWD
ncbi:MAG: DUF1015 domain-containing protein [Chloroflexota bacterium]|nr:DUF1015 domain-containing protein [Chloroflexota bacterium]